MLCYINLQTFIQLFGFRNYLFRYFVSQIHSNEDQL